uniref:NADH dehydrogenase [ubiquinone] 1 alpha subcomplex subunit 3 n=1 Tax=Gorilla gorilla gorilla TaxID=9595 RepID=G3S343_GORGO
MVARVGAFLKNAWDKEPVLVVSFVVGGLAFSSYFSFSRSSSFPFQLSAGEKGHRIELSSHSTQRQSCPGARRS